MRENPSFIYIPEIGVYVEFNLLLARYQRNVFTVMDSRGNIHRKEFQEIIDGGLVTLSSSFTFKESKKEKQKFEGLDAIIKKLSLLYPEIRITKQKFLKTVKKAYETGNYQETQVKNMIKMYIYLSCYEEGRVKPNSKDWFVIRGKPEIRFPEKPIQPIPLG